MIRIELESRKENLVRLHGIGRVSVLHFPSPIHHSLGVDMPLEGARPDPVRNELHRMSDINSASSSEAIQQNKIEDLGADHKFIIRSRTCVISVRFCFDIRGRLENFANP